MSRYEERLHLLERVAARLRLAGVPCQLRRYTPNAAPGNEDERWIPALNIDGGWRSVRVLYWSAVPMFVYPDSVTRYSTDAAGVDRLAALIVLHWHDHRAARHPAGDGHTDTPALAPR